MNTSSKEFQHQVRQKIPNGTLPMEDSILVPLHHHHLHLETADFRGIAQSGIRYTGKRWALYMVIWPIHGGESLWAKVAAMRFAVKTIKKNPNKSYCMIDNVKTI